MTSQPLTPSPVKIEGLEIHPVMTRIVCLNQPHLKPFLVTNELSATLGCFYNPHQPQVIWTEVTLELPAPKVLRIRRHASRELTSLQNPSFKVDIQMGTYLMFQLPQTEPGRWTSCQLVLNGVQSVFSEENNPSQFSLHLGGEQQCSEPVNLDSEADNPLGERKPKWEERKSKWEELKLKWEERTSTGEELKLKREERTSTGEELKLKWEERTSKGDELTSKGDELTSKGDELTSTGDELTSTGDELTSTGDVLTSTGDVLTSTGDVLTSIGDEPSKEDEEPKLEEATSKEEDQLSKGKDPILEMERRTSTPNRNVILGEFGSIEEVTSSVEEEEAVPSDQGEDDAEEDIHKGIIRRVKIDMTDLLLKEEESRVEPSSPLVLLLKPRQKKQAWQYLSAWIMVMEKSSEETSPFSGFTRKKCIAKRKPTTKNI